MEQITLNGKFEITFPDDFYVMSDEEVAPYKFGLGGETAYLKAPDLHMIISLGVRKNEGVGGFFGKLLTGDDLVGNLESCYSRNMKRFGYRKTDNISRDISGIQANGIRYEYTAQNIEMTGESLALKNEKADYYLHVYYRTNVSEASRVTWNEILDTAKWK